MPYYEQIPTEADWADLAGIWKRDDDDVDYARDRFFGKSIDEVMDYFYGAVLGAQENLFYMSRRPFAYYVQAIVRYLKEAAENPDDPRFSDRSTGAESFLKMVIRLLEHSPVVICPVMDQLLEVAQFVADNQALYDPGIDVSRYYPGLLSQIQSLHKQQCPSPNPVQKAVES